MENKTKQYVYEEQTGKHFELKKEEKLDQVAAKVSFFYLFIMIFFFLWQLFDIWVGKFTFARIFRYLDFEPLPDSKELIQKLDELGKLSVFISNNSSFNSARYANRLSEILEIKINMEQIYTSTQATISYIKSNNITKIYALGTPEYEQEIMDSGIELTRADPELVVIAFDKTLTYEKLKTACLLIQGGKKYIATHPDKVCPTKEGYIPDAGAIISFIETATGVEPMKICGKPNPEMIHFLLNKFQIKPKDAIIFGDRIYTDMRMGKDSGITTALMLTGEAKIEDIEQYGIVPEFVFKDITEVLYLIQSM